MASNSPLDLVPLGRANTGAAYVLDPDGAFVEEAGQHVRDARLAGGILPGTANESERHGD